MRKLWILNILVLTLFVSCSDDDDGPGNPTEGISVNTSDFIGRWQITRFIDDGEDESADLDNFSLDFRENNDLVISEGSQEITASWSLRSNGRILNIDIDDDDADQIDPDGELEELDDEWIFISLTDRVMELLEEDDDDDDRDELTLTKVR